MRKTQASGVAGLFLADPTDRPSLHIEKGNHMNRIFVLMTLCMLSVCLLSPSARAEDTSKTVQLLYVQNSQDVRIEKDKLILKDIAATTIYFSDRPERIAGHMTTSDFVAEWGEGKNSFAADPPNASVSIFGENEIIDIVVTLKNPRLVGDDLVYDSEILLEDKKPISGQCSLFIDPVGRPRSPTSVAGVHRRERSRVVRHEVIR